MRTAGELSGLAVVREAAGERLGRVHDVLFDPASGRVAGFLVRTGGGLFSKPQFLPQLLVRSLGQDALLVESGAVLEEVHSEPVAAGAISAHALDGRPVLDATGTVIGHVADVLVNDDGKSVAALTLSTGLLGNLMQRRPRLPLSQIRAIGEDSVVTTKDFDPQTAEL